MECNKDEALRSLDIAEKKFGVQDYAGAKKFVIKAQQLFPALEGAAQMLAVVEVHNTAQGRALGGEHDWYGMLQADPYADEATIRKQYRKLAFTLHPDKNKFVGAESAFKLIGEAWTVLSDKDKRFTYNEKRGIKVQNMNFNQAPQGLNGFNNLHQASSSAAASRPYSTATFWTACPYCKMQYQYFRTYENFHLLCQKCKRGYVARDVNAMNGFPWSNAHGNFGPQFRPESLFTKFATSSKSGSSFPNGFVNGNAYSHMSSSATVSGATSATATATTTTATASTKMTGATTSSGSAGASALAAEFVREMYQKAKKDRVESQKEEKRKEKEKEKQEREKEKEERRNEREAQKKLREDEKKREAMLKLLMKRKEMEEREAARRKKSDKLKTKSKKNDSDESEETDVDEVMEENEEDADSPDIIFSNAHDAPSEEAFKVELRRSSRMKRNVSYRLDGSDDENAETSQYLKRSKFETGAAFGNGKQAESWRPLGCQSQIADDGLIQNIQEMSSASGEVLLKTVKVDEPHKLELAGKFRSFLKEYVLPRSQHVSEDNKAERDFRSLKKCAAIKKEGKKLRSDKKKVAKVDKSGNSVKKFQTKVKICEPSEQSQCPPSQVHELGNEDGVSCQKQAGLDISPPSSPKSDHEEASLKNITVPDPDFHNFDADRTESKLSMGQLWAVYDDKDGMPRFYCRITRILCLDPFKVRVRWLDPDKSSEEVIKWVDSDHLLTCGELKLSNSYETFEQINVFSHVMLADVSQKGLIKMYPKKGEVWALYRGWTQEWFQQSSDGNERNYTYDMVEVVTDFSEEIGVYMILLVKVQGFKTLFEQAALEKSESLHCTPKEVFKFSHRVPAHRKCGAEAPNVPEGCWELDPASTPLELIYGQASESQRAK